MNRLKKHPMRWVLTLFSIMMFLKNQETKFIKWKFPNMQYIYKSYPTNLQLIGQWSSKLDWIHEVVEPHTALVQLALSPLRWGCESDAFYMFHHCSVESDGSQAGQCRFFSTAQTHSVGRIHWFHMLKWVGMSVRWTARQTLWLWGELDDKKRKKIERREISPILLSCHPE